MAGAGEAGASSSYASTSTARSSTYHVFLNFRGDDTRKGFTGHLYSALDRERIKVFMDSHKLQEGEEIGPKLMEAIQGSKISIPILSKGYADSKWCLMELEKILKCNKSNGQIVLPIFFDVEPSDVRSQSGTSFAKAFLEHERNFQPQRVKHWREALRKIGSMTGWVLNQIDNGDESKLIQLVVKRILSETSSVHLSDVKYSVGLNSRVNDFRYLLNIGSKDVRFVGICGEGGIGKTTIAKALYNRYFGSFQQNCFLANIREEALRGPKGLVSLQKKLIYSILKGKFVGKILDIDHGKEEIRNKCGGVNVLLVLDDVDDHSQLDALAIDLKWFGQGSRVIITTRDEHVLNVANVDYIYCPKELDFGQSLRLFSLHAFKQDKPFEEYKKLSREVVRYSGGLPLALVVLGSYLSDVRNKDEWESALQIFRASPHKKVYKSLKISYDNLEHDDQKAIFLDAACFFVGWPKEDLIFIWEARGYHPKFAIKKLVQRSLLKFITKEDLKEYLEMHDVIRDMGRQIVLEESCDMPGKRSRLWIRKEIVEVFEGHKGTENVKGIHLPSQWTEQPQFPSFCLSIECLKKMSNLKYLDIPYARSEGDDFLHLPCGLICFSWHGCSIKVLQDDFYHESLVLLDLSESEIQVAWNNKPQNEYKKFQSLKVLKFCCCRSLHKCPNFSWFPSLERLDLSACNSLRDLDESIGQLRHLKSLDLHSCETLSKLPESIRDLKSLLELDLAGTNVKELPDSICRLSSLQRLDLSCCQSFMRLPDSIGDLKSLVKLKLDDTEIGELPKSIGLLEKLEILSVQNCGNPVKLPSSIGRMSCLHTINLKGTPISELPTDFPMLSSLLELHMSCKCNVEIEIKPCPLGIRFSGFPSQLQRLALTNCMKLESLPSGLSDLKNLRALVLIGWEKLRYLPELPSSLTFLVCQDCKSLERLPDLSSQKNLIRLYLENCYKLEKIRGLGGIKSLLTFTMMGCYHKVVLQERPLLPLGPGCTDYRLPSFARSFPPGLNGDRTYAFLNANDGIHKQLFLIIVFAFNSYLKEYLEEGELVDIELRVCTDIFGKYGNCTDCCHTIFIEKVEFTTERDIIYIHPLQGFTWFGLPLVGKDAMMELDVSSNFLCKHSESGVNHWSSWYTHHVTLKSWSLEYVNEESGKELPNQKCGDKIPIIDMLSGPWPHAHADAGAGSHRVFVSHSAFIEQGHFRSKYIASNYGNVRPWLRDTKERIYFVLEGPFVDFRIRARL